MSASCASVKSISALCCALGMSAWLCAQQPELDLREMYSIGGTRSVGAAGKSTSASLKVYSDGAYLSLYIDVRDPKITLNRAAPLSDQVIVTLALPEEAFPENFSYPLHPDYVMSPAQTGKAPYIFSVQPGAATRMDTKLFGPESDYPDAERIRREGLDLPAGSTLRSDELHFGMVQYAFFPDNRPPVLLDRREQGLVEQALGVKMGKITDGIKYVAENREHGDGYVLNIQLSPQALGYVQAPRLNQLRIMVDVADVTTSGGKAEPVLSSSRTHSYHPMVFNQIQLSRPLQTNFSGISDEMLYKTGFAPLLFWSETGWVPVALDVDALVNSRQQASHRLTELKVYRQVVGYERQSVAGTEAEVLTVDLHYVNAVSRERQYLMIYNQLITVERAKYIETSPDGFRNAFFTFPDGAAGIILRSNTPVHPYGWGDCSNCIEESIGIHRFTPSGRQDILYIYQGDGPNAYVKAGNVEMAQFYIAQFDWIRDGQVLVLRLQHRYEDVTRRLKISWRKDGSGVETVLL